MITQFSLRRYLSISDKACKPRRENGKITFRLNLANIYECSITKVVDRESVRIKYNFFSIVFYINILLTNFILNYMHSILGKKSILPPHCN